MVIVQFKHSGENFFFSKSAICFSSEAVRKISSIRQLDEQIYKPKTEPNRVTEEQSLRRRNEEQIGIQTEFIAIPKRLRKQHGT